MTGTVVLSAFKRIPLPASNLVVQPPGGKTLVNFDTLFHTNADPFTRTVRLLGQSVELEITPTTFTWTAGDGTTFTTDSPGLAYDHTIPMDRYVSHRYQDAHTTVKPSVDTTYSARFSVNGGPWHAVDGTVTMEGTPVDLRVAEATPVLASEARGYGR